MRPNFDVERLLDPPEWRVVSRSAAPVRSCRADDGLGYRARGPHGVWALAHGGKEAADPSPSDIAEVLGLVCAGLSEREIAEGLGASPQTVTRRIARALVAGKNHNPELVARARAILSEGPAPH